MSELFAVVGASGCGRGLMPILREQFESVNVSPDQLVFVDDAPELIGKLVNGHEVLSSEVFISLTSLKRRAVVGIADSRIRALLVGKLESTDIEWLTLRHSSVVQMDNVVLGAGACLSPHVVLTSNIEIGRHFHANLFSMVEHDCVIGDFVTFAPRATCNGNVVIEDHAYIGSGAILRQGKPGAPLVIGAGATVGMGAVVTKSVAPGVTVVGNPARPLHKS